MARGENRHRFRLLAGTLLALVVAVALPFACIRPVDSTLPPHSAKVEGVKPTLNRPARILLLDGQPQATVRCSDSFAIYTDDAKAAAYRGRSLRESVVRPNGTSLTVGPRSFRCRKLRIVTYADGTLAVNGTGYRGELVIFRDSADHLSVMNVVPVEAYLYGVVGGETYAGWPPAAHEAQAIIARTYAYWRMSQRHRERFDLHATVLDQNYLGMARENPKLRTAVDRTCGTVLLYQMELFRCYYHSTCGGHTESVDAVFPDPCIAPLRGVPCSACKDSKHYRWTKTLSSASIEAALERAGAPVAGVAKVEATSRTKSGRALDITVTSKTGRTVVRRASEFRLIVGARTLPSTFVEILPASAGFTFRGRGWGHGVGLCQWGSRGMALRGTTAMDILLHYYPGATLRKLL
ncbi:SpoIID/LytB domain-containing protein [bacterium]|nr:SpoIID/LytB domain-containing protein [bacterium]